MLVIVALAAAFIVIAGLRSLSDIIGPTFLALVLVVAAHPLRSWCTRKGLPRWVGTVLAIVAIYAVLLGLVAALLVSGARFAAVLPTYEEEFANTLQDGLSWLESVGVGQDQIDEISGALDLGSIVGALGGFVSGLLGLVSSLFFLVTLVLFMVLDGTGLPERLKALPPERRMWADSLTGFARGTCRYLVVSTVFGLIVAAIDTVALVWIGVPASGCLGAPGVHHQLHPQHRLRHRRDPACGDRPS